MNCKEVRNRVFDFCEQFGPGVKLHDELTKHIADCGDCAIFYEHMVQDGFLQIDQEKQTELNPYLINKILLKTTGQNIQVFQKKVFFKTPVYVASVLLAGILTGMLISSLTPAEDTTTQQLIQSNDVAATNTDATTSSDNSTLTLSDW